MPSRAIQCKQVACTPILIKLGKGSQRNMCVCLMGIPRLARSAWAENITNAWLTYTNICDRIWENPACRENAQAAQCALLVPQVRKCQSRVFIIHVKEPFY